MNLETATHGEDMKCFLAYLNSHRNEALKPPFFNGKGVTQMLTLRKAFFNNITSPTLVELWSGQHSAEVKLGGMYRWFFFGFVLMTYATFEYGIIFSEEAFVSLFTLYVITLMGTVLMFITDPMRKFLRDCKSLSKHINEPGLHTRESLNYLAKEQLVLMAQMVVINQKYKKVSGEQECRKNFSNAYRVFRSFKLVDIRGWDSYFAVAKERDKLGSVEASV